MHSPHGELKWTKQADASTWFKQYAFRYGMLFNYGAAQGSLGEWQPAPMKTILEEHVPVLGQWILVTCGTCQ